MVEAEAGICLEGSGSLAARAVEEVDLRAALGAPAIVLDVGPAAQRERERVHDVGELDQHEPALGEAEGMHVGGLAHRL